MKDGNVFGSDSRQYAASHQPVWLEVKERKTAGGTIDISNLAKGTLIPLGVPVYLPKMGGDAVILDAYKVSAAVGSTDTAVKLDDGIYGTKPVKGMIVGAISGGTATAAAALGTFTEGTGFAITANSLGELSKGDYVYIISAAGASKAAVMPTGLSWREIYVDTDNPTKATVAVVTKGQILGDRIPEMPAVYKEALKGITFEYEL